MRGFLCGSAFPGSTWAEFPVMRASCDTVVPPAAGQHSTTWVEGKRQQLTEKGWLDVLSRWGFLSHSVSSLFHFVLHVLGTCFQD